MGPTRFSSLSVAVALVLYSASHGAEEWVDITSTLAGTAAGPGGVTLVASVPGSIELVAAVSEKGLFTSSDLGASWKPMGSGLHLRPTQILFDPLDAKTFWVAGTHGPGPFVTRDGGMSFKRLGAIDNAGAIAIDWHDAKRKTLLACLAETDRGVTRSTNGGVGWGDAGGKLGEDAAWPAAAYVVDAKTWIVSCADWRKDRQRGLVRTSDGGKSWLTVQELASLVPPLVVDDAVYWPIGRGEGILRSTDRGVSWQRCATPATASPCLLPGGRIAALAEKQVVVSNDRGATWTAVGPELPWSAAGVVYSEKVGGFVIWRGTGAPLTATIARWYSDLADAPVAVAPEPAATPTPEPEVADQGKDDAKAKEPTREPKRPAAPLGKWKTPTFTAYSGESEKGYGGWTGSPGVCTFLRTVEHARKAPGCAKWHVDIAKDFINCGWNWHGWHPKDAGSDITPYKALRFAVKVDGAAKPQWVKFAIATSNNTASNKLDLASYCPTAFDGEWHDVTVPLKDLESGAFDKRKTWELQLETWSAVPLKFDLFLDEIGFDK